jgi:hypothetical protein
MNEYIIANGDRVEIDLGDWVDVTPNLLPLDKTTGLSYEVCSLYQNEVGIKVNLGENFSEVVLSPIYINGNYRKVQK